MMRLRPSAGLQDLHIHFNMEATLLSRERTRGIDLLRYVLLFYDVHSRLMVILTEK